MVGHLITFVPRCVPYVISFFPDFFPLNEGLPTERTKDLSALELGLGHNGTWFFDLKDIY